MLETSNQMTIKAIVAHAHDLVTFAHHRYHNLNNGYLVDIETGAQVTVEQIYPSVRAVYNSQHQLIAKRKRLNYRLVQLAQPKVPKTYQHLI